MVQRLTFPTYYLSQEKKGLITHPNITLFYENLFVNWRDIRNDEYIKTKMDTKMIVYLNNS